MAPPPHPRQAEARRVARAGGGDDDGDGGALPGGAAVGKGAVQADRPLVRLQRGLLPRDDAGSRLLHEHDGRLLPPRDRRQRERGRGALARVGRGALGRQGDEQPSLRPPEPGAVAAAGDDAPRRAARRRCGGAVAAGGAFLTAGARGGAVGVKESGRRAASAGGRSGHLGGVTTTTPTSSAQTMASSGGAPASAPAPPILCARTRPPTCGAPLTATTATCAQALRARRRRRDQHAGGGAHGRGRDGVGAVDVARRAARRDEDVGVLRGRGWALVRENVYEVSPALTIYWRVNVVSGTARCHERWSAAPPAPRRVPGPLGHCTAARHSYWPILLAT